MHLCRTLYMFCHIITPRRFSAVRHEYPILFVLCMLAVTVFNMYFYYKLEVEEEEEEFLLVYFRTIYNMVTTLCGSICKCKQNYLTSLVQQKMFVGELCKLFEHDMSKIDITGHCITKMYQDILSLTHQWRHVTIVSGAMSRQYTNVCLILM